MDEICKTMSPNFLHFIMRSTFMQRLLSRVDIISERLRGVDFTRIVDPEELGLDERVTYRGTPSDRYYINRVLKDMGITRKDRLVDVGCAKGKAIRCALRFPFEVVDGVELSDRLCNIAANNFETLGIKNVTIFNEDAANFKLYGNYDFIYMYNPFPEHVMAAVIKTVNSQVSGEREMIIIYNYPACSNIILQNGFAKIREYPSWKGAGIYVYTNKPQSSRLICEATR